jgi:hypothetical protein
MTAEASNASWPQPINRERDKSLHFLAEKQNAC